MMPQLSRRAFVALPCGCIAAFIAGCAGGGSPLAQLGQHASTGLGVLKSVAERPSFTDTDEERMAQANAQKFDVTNAMWDDPLLDAYVTDIAQRLVAVAKPRPFPYRTRVVRDPSVNAFTFGGGLVYVHAGLLARMDNEAQLAMVLGHEIAHVTERHVTKGIEATYGIQLLGQLAMTAASTTVPVSVPPEALQKAYEYTMNAAISGHGRSRENEADEIGLDYMVRVGYDPREAPRTFEQLLKEYGDQAPLANFFYGNHPTNVSRIERTTGLLTSKYSDRLAGDRVIVNTTQYRQRTREIVVAVGQLDYERSRFKTATAMFQKAIQTGVSDPVPHYYLGKIAVETGGVDGLDRGITSLGNATKVDTRYAPAYRELGLAYYRKGNRREAISALERYLVLDPHATDAARIRASIAEIKRF
jgi:predicted Zn-dependent protease